MSSELIINASLPETRIALLEGGEIQELLIERASGKGIVGNIYKGRVTRVLPGMQAAFVDIGLEKAAFLYVDDVYVHSEIWAEEEGLAEGTERHESVEGSQTSGSQEVAVSEVAPSEPVQSTIEPPVGTEGSAEQELESDEATSESFLDEDLDEEDDDDDDDDDHGPVGMGSNPKEGDDGDSIGNLMQPPETLAPSSSTQPEASASATPPGQQEAPVDAVSDQPLGVKLEVKHSDDNSRRRHRRGRRGGRNRHKGQKNEFSDQEQSSVQGQESSTGETYPESYHVQMTESEISQGVERPEQQAGLNLSPESRPSSVGTLEVNAPVGSMARGEPPSRRPEFREPRSRDRRVRAKASLRPSRGQVNIQDLLKEGQEVLVQVAKDPIATKGARLTCHISLPGRHLVCMPTIDHVGVSRRIDRDDERRRLRDFVDRNRPRNLGFIVRTATASGKVQSEKRIKQDIEYLSRLWDEIREKTASVTAPALVYEDLNSVLRAIRDWVTEDIDKIIVDSRYHHNDILRFVSHFMPALRSKVELYHGDIPIFDAYNISTELSRALERKVWLKSGGYIVIDQAEALVAIDVNTGRYVGKKNLEDTILKTNLEAVQEIAYQLRLRNCGGIIILDLIDMEKEENRLRVYRALEDAIKKDRARPTILKISELGLVEMTRKRTRDTIIRTLCESCSHCEGKGFIKNKQTVAYEVMREVEREGIEREVGKILVQAHPDVIDILAIDERETLDQMERRYRKSIFLQAVGDFHPEQFEVVSEKREHAGKAKEAERSWVPSINKESHLITSEGRGRGRAGGRDRNRDRNRSAHQSVAVIQVRPKIEISPVRLDEGLGEQGELPTKEAAVSDISLAPGTPPLIIPVNEQFRNEELLKVQTGAGSTGVASMEHRLSEDDFDEEDRLAFLRAQAAQDAALANLAAATANTRLSSTGRSSGGGGSGSSNRWGRTNNKRGGHRGGKGKRFGPRNARGPQPYRGSHPGGEIRPVIQPVSSEAPKIDSPKKDSENGGDQGGGSGTGGDHSTPLT